MKKYYLLLSLLWASSNRSLAQEQQAFRVIVEEFAIYAPFTKIILNPDSIHAHRQFPSGVKFFRNALTPEESQRMYQLLKDGDILKFEDKYEGVPADGTVELAAHDYHYRLRIKIGEDFSSTSIYKYRHPFFQELVSQLNSLVPPEHHLHYNEGYLSGYKNKK